MTEKPDQPTDAADASAVSIDADQVTSSNAPPLAPLPDSEAGEANAVVPETLPHFQADPALEAAMAEALASSERREVAHGADDEGEGVEIAIETDGSDAPNPRAPPMPTGAGEGIVRALAQLRQTMEELESTQRERDQYKERLLRASADLENFKKRSLREQEQARKFANESIVKELVPVLDNLERALEVSEVSADQVRDGVEMVHKGFLSMLARFGVEQFSVAGEAFDPERMEAMQQMESAEHPPGTVIQEFMRGYFLNDRLLRPAMVIVSKAPTEPTPSSDSEAVSEEADPDQAPESESEAENNGEHES